MSAIQKRIYKEMDSSGTRKDSLWEATLFVSTIEKLLPPVLIIQYMRVIVLGTSAMCVTAMRPSIRL